MYWILFSLVVATITCTFASFIFICVHLGCLDLNVPMKLKIEFVCSRYYDLVDPQNGILKKGREILLTGCYLRTAAEGSGCPRLLPTEYLVILLDEVTDTFLLPIFSPSGSFLLLLITSSISFNIGGR